MEWFMMQGKLFKAHGEVVSSTPVRHGSSQYLLQVAGKERQQEMDASPPGNDFTRLEEGLQELQVSENALRSNVSKPPSSKDCSENSHSAYVTRRMHSSIMIRIDFLFDK
jgi:hypothetical protein